MKKNHKIVTPSFPPPFIIYQVPIFVDKKGFFSIKYFFTKNINDDFPNHGAMAFVAFHNLVSKILPQELCTFLPSFPFVVFLPQNSECVFNVTKWDLKSFTGVNNALHE